ncbi:MAG TPA: CDP-alcohol phosphatidyltransferase family protein [Gemmatimonadales bacterium]|nr:CDP-alcohol phosphatidyltransferase family protein [Gemmatimonadales bacterium]
MSEAREGPEGAERLALSAGRRQPPWSQVPNSLSVLRIVLALALVPATLLGERSPFVALLLLAFVTDAADGFLARQLGAMSERGRQLDSLGDYVLVLTLLPGLFVLWPALMRAEAPWITLAVCAYFGPTIWSLARWRTVPGLHTWASKGLAVAMSAALPLALLGGPVWPLRVCCALQLLVAVEEVAILLRMPGHSGHVRTVFVRGTEGQTDRGTDEP